MHYHSRANKILNCLLNLPHIHSPSKVQIFVQEVTMPVLLSSPCPCPNCPGSGACTRLIPDTIEGVKHSLVCWKSLLSNHVSNQTNKVIIRDLLGTFSELLNFIMKSFRCWIREEILWLPTLLDWLQMCQYVIPSPVIKRLEYFDLLRWQ